MAVAFFVFLLVVLDLDDPVALLFPLTVFPFAFEEEAVDFLEPLVPADVVDEVDVTDARFRFVDDDEPPAAVLDDVDVLDDADVR